MIVPKHVDRLTLVEYREQDIPVKCCRCRRWMRCAPEMSQRKRRYVKRCAPPNAATCAECFAGMVPAAPLDTV